VNLAAAYFLFGAAKQLWRAEKPENRTFAALRVWPWLVVIAATVLPWLFLRPFSIPTGSMEDTILMGDYILVETVSPRLGRLPRDGDLVVFRYPPDRRQIFVKRIEGVAGDRLHFRNKQLYRNGSPVTESYARHKTDYIDSYRDNLPSEANARLYAGGEKMLAENVKDGEVVVPPGAYFVLGDNRDASLDSRYWGFVPSSDIIGTPLLIYASYDSGSQPGDKGSQTILNLRWRRLLKRF
jgi:signal peptidase I